MKVHALNGAELSFERVPGNRLRATYLRITPPAGRDTVVPLSKAQLAELIVEARRVELA